jgi:16S rRNA (guanine1516-N2)-methyltransferase
VKKKFQVLHQLEQPCTDETELLDAAVSAGPRKIVIKRPLKGPYLAGRKPDYSLKGKAIRYDCIILQKKGQI